MHIDWVELNGYRNFDSVKVRLQEKTLIIGPNDVGKTTAGRSAPILGEST